MAQYLKDIVKSPDSPDNWEELLLERMREVPLALRLASLTPEQRLADLTPEQRLLALPDEMLRRLPADFVQSLSATVQREIRRRLTRG